MARIIAIANQKGGVGKTSTAINLSTALSAVEKNVLLIDLDPQGNSSSGLGIEQEDRVNKTILEVILEELKINEVIIKTQIPKLDIISANQDLVAAEIELHKMQNKEYILKDNFAILKNKYDYIIIDCPPSLSMLSINALVAANSVLIPVQCEFFALEGLSHLLYTIKTIQENYNRRLQIEGVLLTMYDRRNKLTEQVEKDIKTHFKSFVLDTVIPRNVKISEAPSFGLPAILYDHKCSGAISYMMLAKEILQKESK